MKTNILYKILLVGFLLLSTSYSIVIAQSEAKVHLKNLAFTKSNQKYVQFKFKLVNNLVIIPITINNSDTLNFILDTGASYIVLSDPSYAEKLNLSDVSFREVTLKGMGEDGKLKAYHSWGNSVKILNAIEGFNQDIIYPSEDIFKLSDSMGMVIHGLIGSTVFKHFVVNIDYQNKTIILYKKEYYYAKKRKRYKKKYESIPLRISKNRAYIETDLWSDDHHRPHQVSLLIDTGASHALSIFESDHHEIKASLSSIRDHLGVGISGDLYGKVNRLEQLSLGSFVLNDPIVKYPDFKSLGLKIMDTTRHGSIGAEVLRRFTVIFDYENEELLIRKNGDFKDAFQYNNLGLEFTNPYPGLPFFQISQIREESPAAKAGIQQGSILKKVNGQSVASLTADQIRLLFRGKIGRKISLAVEDNEGNSKTFSMVLEDPFDQN